MISKVSACESDPAFCIHAGSRKNKLIPVTYSQFQTKFREFIARTGRNERLFSTLDGLSNLE